MGHALIVEDDADSARMMAALVTTEGYSAATAQTLRDARRQLALQPPDLVLLDLMLPGIDGIGVAEALRDQQPDLRTRLVALTGYGDSAIRERTVRAGFHAHLVKPATAAAIFACIATQLEEAARPSGA